jgi:tetratricopeptide (TPR) repeat protein
MNQRLLTGAAIFAAAAAIVTAQTPKSQEEVTAIQAIISATNPDDRMKAVDNLVAKFKDTEFKSWAYSVAGDTAQQKRDNPKAIFYYEQALKADAKAYTPMLMLAGMLAQTTKEFDLDKEEKLNKAEKYVKSALDLIPNAAKPNPQVTDEQWANAKKDDIAQAHVDLGLIASVRKKHDVAIAEYKTALESATTPDAGTMIRLAGAYNDAGKPDDAIATLEKVLAMPNLVAQYKQIAEQEKARAQKAQAAKQ